MPVTAFRKGIAYRIIKYQKAQQECIARKHWNIHTFGYSPAHVIDIAIFVHMVTIFTDFIKKFEGLFCWGLWATKVIFISIQTIPIRGS